MKTHLKLSLKKQKVVALSSKEMEKINGGGEARSDRRTGNCNYSRANPTTCDCPGINGDIIFGCEAS